MIELDFQTVRLPLGTSFEPHVVEVLKRELDWDIGLYTTAHDQHTKGESRGRVEIKFDRRLRDTGNLMIETRERRNSSGSSEWRDSGPYDAADPWFIAQGDEYTIWLFASSLLRLLHKQPRYQIVKTTTAEGFLLPLADADKYAIRRIDEEFL